MSFSAACQAVPSSRAVLQISFAPFNAHTTIEVVPASRLLLASRPAAVDDQRMSGDERGSRRSEKDHCTGHFDRLSNAMEGGDAVNHILAKCRVGKSAFCARCVNKRRRHRVYVDVVLTPLH